MSDKRGPNTGECLWDVEAVTKFLNSSVSWVYLQAEAGKLPCVRIGRMLRFNPMVIRALAEGG